MRYIYYQNNPYLTCETQLVPYLPLFVWFHFIGHIAIIIYTSFSRPMPEESFRLLQGLLQ